jgi:hypothetical protein
MKLFGGKKGDDKQPQGGDDEAGYYDSPQETVSLSGTSVAPKAPVAATAPQMRSTAQAPVMEDEPRPHYGIDQAIMLMRALPVDQNVELVVQVIKTTLESLKVKVADIISDADRKTHDLDERMANLKRAIADFEKEIETRRQEIARLEADHAETSSVRARLELAERAQRATTASGTIGGAKGPVSKTG